MKKRKDFTKITLNIRYRYKSSNTILNTSITSNSVGSVLDKFKEDYPDVIYIKYKMC